MKFHVKDFMYFCAVTLMPSLFLFKKMLELSLVAYVVSLLIFRFDPLISDIRKNIEKTSQFYFSCSLLGAVLGGLSFIFNGGLGWFFAWISYFLVISHYYSERFKRFNEKKDD